MECVNCEMRGAARPNADLNAFLSRSHARAAQKCARKRIPSLRRRAFSQNARSMQTLKMAFARSA
eukprot:3904734-Lingulodinium_polyedra.AAC.1